MARENSHLLRLPRLRGDGHGTKSTVRALKLAKKLARQSPHALECRGTMAGIVSLIKTESPSKREPVLGHWVRVGPVVLAMGMTGPPPPFRHCLSMAAAPAAAAKGFMVVGAALHVIARECRQYEMGASNATNKCTSSSLLFRVQGLIL